jgi:SAM-dependent MidA family methyltransferase
LLEIGAGSGVLAVELLLELERLSMLPEHYMILELSGVLIERQREIIQLRIPHLLNRITWLSQWPTTPFQGVVIANELFDAMPVHRFKMESSIREYYVTHDQTQFQWLLGDPSEGLLQQLQSYDIKFERGYTSEINLLIKPWLRGLRDAMGLTHLIFIDYGYKREAYYHPERSMGTLMCHYQHQAIDDPLIRVGFQDITAHVDFTLIAEAALDLGFELESFRTQAQFLMDAGITTLLSDNASLEAKQLLLPGCMGEAFKVIELSC